MNILRVKRKALEILERVERDSAYVHLLLQQEASTPSAAPEEYPILVQLVRGVLEQQGVIDDTLMPLLPKGLHSLPTSVQHLLRIATYQILFLDRVKKRDVVFEAVELAKTGKYKGLAKLVNAVLRKVEPKATTNVSQETTSDASRNFPEWLVTRWNQQFGHAETTSFCNANNRPLPLYLRVNTLKNNREQLHQLLSAEGVQTEPVRFSPAALRVQSLPKHIRINQLDSYKAGRFFVQDLSSTIVADITSSNRPQLVADVCAAPGGKSCSIALSIADTSGTVYAFDHSPKRVQLIKDASARLGIPNITCDIRDALHPNSKMFDAVLVDAPCSGFGTLGRKIDARWSKSESTIQELASMQANILETAAQSVKINGHLVYSTCTIEPAENEAVIKQFLSSHKEFVVEHLSTLLPSELCTAEGFYRAWPQHHEMAGAFATKLRRTA